MTGEPSYVFKTSKTAALIALKMDPKTSTGSESAMTEEEAYLDGMHSRVKGYKSLEFVDIPSRDEESYMSGDNGHRKRRH